MKYLVSTLLVIILSIALFTNVLATTREGVIFMTISPGPRPASMGESYVAIADDALAMHWNPAGLGFMKSKFYMTPMHSPWLSDISNDIYYEYLGFAGHKKEWGTFAASLTYLTYGTILRTDETGNETGEMHPYEATLGLGFGTELAENLSVGIAVKYIYSALSKYGSGDEETRGVKGIGTSVAGDIGILYKVPDFNIPFTEVGVSNLQLGANLSNLGPNIAYIDEQQSDPLPRTFRFGFAYYAFDSDLFGSLMVTSEWRKLLIDWREGDPDSLDPSNGLIYEMKEAQFGIGLEYTYLKILSLRGGYYFDREGFGGEGGTSYIKGFTFGGGLQYDFTQMGLVASMDFSLIPGGDLQPSGEKYYGMTLEWRGKSNTRPPIEEP